jgi:uncharacterized membrane protein
MTRLKKFSWTLIFLGLHYLILGYYAFTLPADAQVPFHWNIQDQIDGWTSKSTALIFFGLLNLGLFLLFYAMPWYSPRYRKHEDRYEKVIPALSAVMIFFFMLLAVYSLWLAASGNQMGMKMILVPVGLLFIFLGNLLPKVPKNFFIGIRTPWTLSSEDIWQRTHRLGGWCFVISGILMVIRGLMPNMDPTLRLISAIAILGVLLYPGLHSLILYLKKKH